MAGYKQSLLLRNKQSLLFHNNLPLVSVIVVTFNSQKYIKDCLGAVMKTNYPSLEIIVVDNNSQDKTQEIVEGEFSKVKLIRSGSNLGYAGGNNLGASYAKGDYIAILNPDTQVLRDWLQPLVEAIKPSNIAACQPKIMLLQEKNLINLTGKTTHFLGFGWPTDYQKKDYKISPKEIISFSGSAILIKKDIFLKLGGFDDDFFMYYEDGDLSWRLRLAGYKILLVPDSVVHHEYKYQPEEEYQRARKKFYFLERNRLLMILKNYSTRTLLLILPAILFMEIGMSFYFLSKGWWLEKWKGHSWIIKNLSRLMNAREKTQQVRVSSDKQLTKDFVSRIEFSELDSPLLKYFANPFLAFYWRAVRRFV